MATPMSDRWRVFIGYLAESTGYRNQRTFHIYVPEYLPTLTGDITPETSTHTVEVTNVMTNQKESVNVQTATTITAEYLGVLTSRTVPTMYKNQQVLVLNFATDDRFFWLPLERDDYMRTFEQIRFSALDQAITNKSRAVGDDVEGKQAGITDDNSYFLEIDTKYHKHILLSTSASDGEDWRYFFKIDTNSRSVEIWDQPVKDKSIPSNSIKLESQPMPGCRGRIKLENAGEPQDDMIETISSYIDGLRNGSSELNFIRLDDPKFQNKMEELDTYFQGLKEEIYLVREKGYENTQIIFIDCQMNIILPCSIRTQKNFH